jgi:hypothetical protein
MSICGVDQQVSEVEVAAQEPAIQHLKVKDLSTKQTDTSIAGPYQVKKANKPSLAILPTYIWWAVEQTESLR